MAIKKKKEDYLFVEGAGRPFDMNERYFEPGNDLERQRPVIIHLGELNGQDGTERVPKNFHTKRGRTLGTFTRLQQEQRDVEEAFDIE